MVKKAEPLTPGRSAISPEQSTKQTLRIQPNTPVPMTATKIATGAAIAAFLTSSLMCAADGSECQNRPSYVLSYGEQVPTSIVIGHGPLDRKQTEHECQAIVVPTSDCRMHSTSARGPIAMQTQTYSCRLGQTRTMQGACFRGQ